MKTVIAAMRIAELAHRGQMRKPVGAGVPYITHPTEVAERLALAGVTDEVTLAAAFLHDVLEDTVDPGTDEHAQQCFAIAKHCGVEVLKLVEELTDDDTLTKHERRDHQATHDYTLRAARIKLADKAANLKGYWLRVINPQHEDVRKDALRYADDARRVRQNCYRILITNAVGFYDPADITLVENCRLYEEELRAAIINKEKV